VAKDGNSSRNYYLIIIRSIYPLLLDENFKKKSTDIMMGNLVMNLILVFFNRLFLWYRMLRLYISNLRGVYKFILVVFNLCI